MGALTVMAARCGFDELQGAEGVDNRCLEVRYEELLARPGAVLGKVESLLDLPLSDDARRFSDETLRRDRAPSSLAPAELEALRLLRGSYIETLLRECGRELPEE